VLKLWRRKSTAKSLEVTGADIVALSRDFIESMNTTRLGRFGLDSDTLLAADVIQRHRLVNGGGVEIKDSLLDFYLTESQRLLSAQGKTINDAHGELFFWWKLSGQGDLIFYMMDELSHNKNLTHRMGFLSMVIDHRDMHDYFAVGIMDTDFIERCMADGIDAEMAHSLVVSA